MRGVMAQVIGGYMTQVVGLLHALPPGRWLEHERDESRTWCTAMRPKPPRPIDPVDAIFVRQVEARP